LLLAALPALGLATGLGHRPAIRQAADGVDAWLVIETLMSPLADAALGAGGTEPRASRGMQQATLLGLATAAVLPLLAWLPAAFLSGGVLLTYAEAPARLEWQTGKSAPLEWQTGKSAPLEWQTGKSAPLEWQTGKSAPRRWRRFLWGCWHWWGAFLLLGAAQGIASLALFVPLIGAAVAAIAAAGWLAWAVVPLLVLVTALWLALTETTRIVAVAEGTRNVARAFVQAVRFVFRNFSSVAGLYGLALLLLGLLHALFRWGVLAHLPLAWWLLVLFLQQTFVLARLGARLVRLAGGVALVQAGSATECASGTGECARPGAW
jgi:hypothetical protein